MDGLPIQVPDKVETPDQREDQLELERLQQVLVEVKCVHRIPPVERHANHLVSMVSADNKNTANLKENFAALCGEEKNRFRCLAAMVHLSNSPLRQGTPNQQTCK